MPPPTLLPLLLLTRLPFDPFATTVAASATAAVAAAAFNPAATFSIFLPPPPLVELTLSFLLPLPLLLLLLPFKFDNPPPDAPLPLVVVLNALVLVFASAAIEEIVSTELMPLLFTLDFCPAAVLALFVLIFTFMIFAAVGDVGEKDVIVLPGEDDATTVEKDAAGMMPEELLIAIV